MAGGNEGSLPKDSTVTESAIRAAYRAKGLRDTWQRRVVAGVLARSPDHPDVAELHRRAFAIDPRISLSTVYRTLKLFEDIGVIERHSFRDGRARYEEASKRHHDHLIDLATGKVIEFRSEEIERLQAEIARRLGYDLVGHRLELYATPARKPSAKPRRSPPSRS